MVVSFLSLFFISSFSLFTPSILSIYFLFELFRPTQSPDGSFLPNEIPPSQMLREMQPDAKFLITLSDPVKRMYSDYYFLDDNLLPVRIGAEGASSKSAEAFHQRSKFQVDEMLLCISNREQELLPKQGEADATELEKNQIWFRASQMFVNSICFHPCFSSRI